MSEDYTRGLVEIEVRLTTDPGGEPAGLLQLPNGFVLMKEPTKIRELASALIDLSDALEEALDV